MISNRKDTVHPVLPEHKFVKVLTTANESIAALDTNGNLSINDYLIQKLFGIKIGEKNIYNFTQVTKNLDIVSFSFHDFLFLYLTALDKDGNPYFFTNPENFYSVDMGHPLVPLEKTSQVCIRISLENMTFKNSSATAFDLYLLNFEKKFMESHVSNSTH